MRLSRVPVRSLYQHDLVYDPGGLRPVLPFTTRQILRSSWITLSAFLAPRIQASRSDTPFRDPHVPYFRGSIQTLLTCSARLLTFVSSRQRVLLLGWWLAVARGRICTSWIAATDFIEEAILKSQRLRV
jgi:hypothetical protein